MRTTSAAPSRRTQSSRRRSAHGVSFDLFDDVWVLRIAGGRISFTWTDLRSWCSAELEMQIREVFSRIAAVHPASSTCSYVTALKRFLNSSSLQTGSRSDRIDATMLANWLGTRPPSAYVGQMRALLLIWRRLRGQGVDAEAFDFAERMVASVGNGNYSGVLTWDETLGPYRPADDEAIRIALDDAFNEGDISLDEYALFRVLRGTGARTESIADLKVEDFRHEGGKWFLRIPMKKQRGILGWRLHFLPWKPISQGLAHVLNLHIDNNIRSRCPRNVDLGLAPLFPASREKDLSLPGAHRPKRTLQRHYEKVMAKLAVVSPITGTMISGNPRRDRHTFLTMLAMNGCTADEIAANAGHSSSASCEPYVDAAIGHFQRMEKLVGAAFVPVADRFLGGVTTSATDERAADPILSDEATGVGSCGIGGCNAIEAGVAPLACYTCRKFRAWSDAPHADLLEILMDEVDRLRADGHAAVAETRMPTIIAIGDLLERIRQNEEQPHG